MFRTTRVRDVMSTNVTSLSEDATVADARELIQSSTHNAYPVVDADGCITDIVSRGDAMMEGAEPADPIGSIATPHVVTVSPDDTLLDALNIMMQEEVDHLPVIDRAEHLVGICTRTDVLRARARQMELEQRQRGWRPPMRMRRRAES